MNPAQHAFGIEPAGKHPSFAFGESHTTSAVLIAGAWEHVDP